MTEKSKIRVLIVDDSAFARKVIREVLEKVPEIEVVGFARDGLDALERIAELKPDVVTLDLVMPDLDGIGVLKSYTKENLPRFVIVSSSGTESEKVIEALHLGAIDVVHKPTASATDKLYDLSHELVLKVKAAALSKVIHFNSSQILPEMKLLQDIQHVSHNFKMVVLGTSTGGPQAITEIFNLLPKNFPVPLVIALHIPAGYTEPLAARVSKTSELSLVEAFDGMELLPNMAVLAPGGMHLTVKNVKGKFFASVSHEPIDTLYHPSIDLLFESAAKATQGALVGVVLTGMGSDGTKGSKVIRELGGVVIAESESSCVVYGMPRSVIEAGASNYECVLKLVPSVLGKILSK